MFQKLFTTLYQALLGTAEPASLIPVYQKSIFPGVGLSTLFGVALGMALLFYVIFNRVLTTSFYKTSHWFIMLLLTAVGSAILAYSQARSVVYASLDGETLGAIEKSAYDRYVLGLVWGLVFRAVVVCGEAAVGECPHYTGALAQLNDLLSIQLHSVALYKAFSHVGTDRSSLISCFASSA
jgi:hypothetical protein